MAPRSRLCALLLVCIATTYAGERQPSRTQSRNPLIGTWALVSSIMTMPDGSMRPNAQVGPTPKGYMI